MSTNQTSAIPQTSPAPWVSADASSSGQSSQPGRQFKHFVFRAHSESFHPQKKQRRNRVRIACSECNLHKIKCSGSRPICKGCQKRKIKCVYRDNDTTRPDESHSPSGAILEPRNGDDEGLTRGVRDGVNEGVSREPRDGVNEGLSREATVLRVQVPPIHAIRAPEFYASLNEHFETFSSRSAANLHSGPPCGSPVMIHMNPPAILQSQSPEPILGPRIDSHDYTRIRIPYFRWFGPTGIVPGFTRVLVDLRQTGSEKSASVTSSPEQTMYPATPHSRTEDDLRNSVRSDSGEQNEPLLFDDEDEMVPNAEILGHLLPIFFDFFGSHFPFYQKDRFMELVRQKSVPAVLLNSMCALGSRFSNHPRIRRNPIYLCGELFGNKAKQIIVVLLAVPSYDLVASLLMLSWYEFGCNRDVGFWMYTGMAIRMAQDLGMHKGNGGGDQNGELSTDDAFLSEDTRMPRESGEDGKVDEDENAMQLNLFWSIYFIDRIISLGTGRPLTLRDEQISCPLPPEWASQVNKSTLPSPFPHMIRIMTIQGKANEEISTIQHQKDLTPSKRSTLFLLQDQIIHIYTNLDPRLTFNVNNFRNSVALGYGGSFLLLHVWFHAVIITIHRPGLMFGKNTLAHTLGPESLEVSMSSANTITSMVTLAELIDDKTITGSPFLNQAIYIAGLAFIAESEMHGKHLTTTPELNDQRNETPRTDGSMPSQCNFLAQGLDSGHTSSTISTEPSSQLPSQPSLANASTASQFNHLPFDEHLNSSFDTLPAPPVCKPAASISLLQFVSKGNYETCLNTIKTLKCVWRGIGWILSTMEQKAKGIVQTDPSEESVDPEAEIDLSDAAMLQRLLAAKSGRSSNGTSMSSSVLYSARLATETGEAWGIGRNQACTYGLTQNGVGIGETWVDLTWLDSLDQDCGIYGYPNPIGANRIYIQ